MTTIIKRLDVGRPLTNAEGDANFENLNVDKVERDGSIPMTGDLQVPGVRSTSGANGLRMLNQSGQLVATFGKDNTKDLTVEGNINVGGGSGNLSLNGGDIEARNIFLTGRIISAELNGQYNVANVGDVYRGTGAPDASDSNKLIITLNTIVTLVNRVGTFGVGQNVSGNQSGTVGTITRIEGGNTLYISLQNPAATFTSGESLIQAGTNGAVNGIVSQIVNTSQLNEDHRIKVFGASAVNAAAVDAAEGASLQKVGNLGGTQSTYHYWITQFRFSDGQISAARKVSGSVTHGAVNLFNEDNHIKITLARTNPEYGIAVYRATANDITQARLIDVLGPSELGSLTTNILYTDFGTFSNTQWSTKDGSGRFTEDSGIVHFPIVPNATARKGWITLTVQEVLDASRVKMTQSVVLNSGSSVEFVHDNTVGLQQAINDNRDLALRNIVLPNGVYYTSRLDIPNDFVVLGSGKLTVIKQIPWNFDHYNDAVFPTNKGNVFKPQTPANARNIYFTNLQVDGNLVNNVRFSDVESNYIASFKNGFNINFDNTIITNVPGGGLYIENSDTLRVQNCEITNGSLTYQGSNLSPIYATQSANLTITGNVCQNFLSPLDISVTNVGVAVGNTIRNCGSGLLVYASRNLLSSPNLIMGPDNEWIPTPDTQDSDFNSVNITINPGVDYTSPSYLFVSRGTPVYLGSLNKVDPLTSIATPGTAVALSSDIFVLTKLNNVEQQRIDFDYTNNTGGQPIINIITPDTGDFGRNNGYFQFRVTEANSLQLPNLSQLLTTHGNALQSGEQLIGLAYRIKATGFTYTEPGERLEIASGTFSTDGTNKFYTVALKNAADFPIFTVGDIVRLPGHASTPDITLSDCIVDEKTSPNLLKLRLPQSTDLSSISNGGETGYIIIRNTVIIAKGRIL